MLSTEATRLAGGICRPTHALSDRLVGRTVRATCAGFGRRSRGKHKLAGSGDWESHLSLYALSDLNPAKLHMTVPTHFRRNSEVPGILVPHYADLPDEEVQATQGFTRPLRTILDLIEADTIERVFLRQAMGQAIHRGLITRQQIKTAKLRGSAQRVFEDLLRKVA